jgi:Mn-dependent DtxR family transcriptional regulator
MIRNTRLLEVLMKDALKIEIDEEMACGIEHHMKNVFTDALCTLLKHPRNCLMDTQSRKENAAVSIVTAVLHPSIYIWCLSLMNSCMRN